MRAGIGARLDRVTPRLAGLLAVAVLLLWSAVASAAPSPQGGHRHAAQAVPVAAAATAQSLAMPSGALPCHHQPARSVPPCCGGPACLSMHVGLVTDGNLALPPSPGAAERPGTGALPDGVGVPPDLPPPRLG